MALWQKLKFWGKKASPEHLERGRMGESAAKNFLKEKGLKFLTANFASRRGEIDLVFRDRDCLVFVEVKTRSTGGWTRPARAVNTRKRQALAHTAQDYLRLLDDPDVAFRFDIVEVILDAERIQEIRHIEGGFNVSRIWKRRR